MVVIARSNDVESQWRSRGTIVYMWSIREGDEVSRRYDEVLDKIQQREAEMSESEQPHQKEVLQQQPAVQHKGHQELLSVS